jgi:hypothetical protein
MSLFLFGLWARGLLNNLFLSLEEVCTENMMDAMKSFSSQVIGI